MRQSRTFLALMVAAALFASASAFAQDVERSFEIEITDLIFPVLSAAENANAVEKMIDGMQVEGHYKPDVEIEGVTYKNNASFKKVRRGWFELPWEYELVTHKEEITKNKSAAISRAANGKIRINFPEKIDEYFSLRELYLRLPTKGIAGFKDLSFDGTYYKVPIQGLAAQNGYVKYKIPARYQDRNAQVTIQLKALVKITLLEDKAQGEENAQVARETFGDDERGDFLAIDYKDAARRPVVQNPAWQQGELSKYTPTSTGIYSKIGNLEALRIDTDIKVPYSDGNSYDHAVFTMEAIRVDGKVVRVSFLHDVMSKFHFGIFFSEQGKKIFYMNHYDRNLVGAAYTKVLTESEFKEILEKRAYPENALLEKQFIEHDKYLFYLDRSVFEQAFDTYKNMLWRGKNG